MKINFIYLSDLHIKDDSTFTELKIANLVKTISSEMPCDFCYVIISGDIAFSGKIDQYEQAKKIFTLLCDKLQNEYNLNGKIKFLIVPGNHDMDFNDEAVNIEDITSINDKNKALDDKLIKMSAFYNFAKEFDCFTRNKQIEIFTNDINGYKIQIVLVNTALFSVFRDKSKHNGKGLHYLSEKAIDDIELQTKASDLTLYIAHHSPEWFEEKSKHRIEEYIKRNVSIAL